MASYLSLHCLLRLVCLNTLGKNTVLPNSKRPEQTTYSQTTPAMWKNVPLRCPMKTQISLHIDTVWSLFAEHSKDSKVSMASTDWYPTQIRLIPNSDKRSVQKTISFTVNVLKFRTLYSIPLWPKFCSLCNCFQKYLVEWQTVKTLIRLLLKEQSDLGLHCLHMPFCQTLWCTRF